MLTSRAFWVILFSAALLPIAVKKVINDFKWVSYTLFYAVVAFLALFVYLLAAQGAYESDIIEPLFTPTVFGRISALSVFLYSYNFSCFEFPMYQALGPDRN